MVKQPYRIRVRHGEVEIEVEGDKAYVNKIFADLKRLLAVEFPVTPSQRKPGKRGEALAPGSKPLSAREFLDRYDIKRHTDIVLAFGYYLEKIQRLSAFTPVDVNRCYYEAKIEPSNTSQMIIQNIKKGFMMEPRGSKEGKRRYVLTQKGEKFVEAGFVKSKK